MHKMVDGNPKPRIHPIWMMAIFCTLMAVCSGPAYNANAFRGFLRESKFLSDLHDPESLLIESGKIFQTIDVMFGVVVGLVFNFGGPRLAQAIGYISFSLGLVLMMSSKTLWFALLLQGVAAVFILNSSLHLANLFERGNKFAISVLSSAVEISVFVFPGLRLGITYGISPAVMIYALTGVAMFGVVVTILLIPGEPFFPKSELSKKIIEEDAWEKSLSEEAVMTGNKPDARDLWVDPEANTETTPLTNIQLRPSRVSISFAALLDDSHAVRKSKDSFLSQLLSFEWMLITLVFSFFIFRVRSDRFKMMIRQIQS